MLYSPLVLKAINIAFDAHAGQLDKAGIPYITHPLHVAESMDDEDSTVAAILHDIVEDTAVTPEDLRREGITDYQIEVIRLLTHEDGVPYMEYIEKLSKNETARKVKLSDLRHNMDRGRLITVTEKDEKRFAKYKKAYDFLISMEK